MEWGHRTPWHIDVFTNREAPLSFDVQTFSGGFVTSERLIKPLTVRLNSIANASENINPLVRWFVFLVTSLHLETI